MEEGEGKVSVTSAEPPKEKPRVMNASVVQMASTFASKKMGLFHRLFSRKWSRVGGGGGGAGVKQRLKNGSKN